MNKKPDQSTQSIISAFAVTDLPEHDDFMFCDDSLLEKKQIYASRIAELKDLIHDFGLPDYPIIFCNLSYMRGCVYLEGEMSYPLIFLDSVKANSIELLRETYIHESAHLLSDGEDHDFAFAVVQNTFRITAGLDPSDEDYDYRACDFDHLSLDDTKKLCVQFSKILIGSNMPLVELIDDMKGSFELYGHMLENKANNTDEILTSFGDFVNSFCIQ